MEEQMQNILFVGFPNAGKSSLFNLLSGHNRKVTNYSGITVDSAMGNLKSNEEFDQKVSIVDLPGIYNLNPVSTDEKIAVNAILEAEKDPYHLIAVVIDIERLESSLSLTLALKEVVGDRLVMVINKDDKGQFSREKCRELEELVGLKAISMSANHKGRKRELDRFLRDSLKNDVVIVNSDYEVTQENIEDKHRQARSIIEKVCRPNAKKANFTHKVDKVLLHPIFGTIIFCAIFYLIFHSIYTWAGPAMDFIDEEIGSFGQYVGAIIPAGLLNSLIVDGIIAGVGGVVIFLPQIMILFFLLNILEQSGYISRAAILSDKVMNIFGLNGKAFLPFMSGFACSIPGIMAARTIPDKKERMATIMTLPMITCSARLPVYILLIGTFVPEGKVFGFFDIQALSFFFLYFLGSFFALFMSLVFRLSLFKGKSSSFFIDLPLYQKPSLLTAAKQSLMKGKIFLKKAGTIILGLSILIWGLSTFPKTDPSHLIGKSEAQVAAISLEHSAMGTLGRFIEPVIEPIGMDWKMGVGILVAFGARELFVSTMGTIYALGEVDEESSTLRERMRKEVHPITGQPLFNLAVAWSILIFFVFSLQCTATLAILKRETGGWKIPSLMFGYMFVLAYSGSYIAYNVLS